MTELLNQLVNELVTRGELRSPEWQTVFRRVPRHPFVSRFHERTDGAWVTIDAELGHDEWLAAVYADRLLVTKVDVNGFPVSSSSMPHMMARFLEMLDVQDGNTVLEIGTGTGYNAALLSERLGPAKVTSIDIDPELVESARAALARCGYAPTLAVGDGHDGCPPRAPFDRIIATCSVPRIPEAWLDQLKPRGVIVTPLAGEHFEAVGLVRLTVRPDGSFEGRFHPAGAMFMPMIATSQGAGWEELFELAYLGAGAVRECSIPKWLDGGPAEVDTGARGRGLEPNFLLRLEVPELHWFWFDNRAGPGKMPAVASGHDRSWARVRTDEHGVHRVEQGGPRRLWNIVERSYEQFVRLGEPDMGRYGLTISPDRHQVVWLDDPAGDYRWEL